MCFLLNTEYQGEKKMKRQKTIMAGIAMILLAQEQVFALDVAKPYSSGVLDGLFVGFCILLIAVQLVPTLMLLVGAARSLLGKNAGQKLGQGV
jgi:hypothetical protein